MISTKQRFYSKGKHTYKRKEIQNSKRTLEFPQTDDQKVAKQRTET